MRELKSGVSRVFPRNKHEINMYLYFILFVAGLLGTVAVLSLKIAEMHARGSLLSSLSRKLDPFFERAYLKCDNASLVCVKAGSEGSRAILRKIHAYIGHVLESVVEFSVSLLAIFVSKVRGKRDISKRAGSSFFLKDVSEHKRKINGEKMNGKS